MKRVAKVIYFPLFLIILKEIENSGPINCSRLGKKCNISYSNLTSFRECLLEKGLVEIKEIDNRSWDLVLTNKGKQVVTAFNKMLLVLEVGDLVEYMRRGGKRI
jgi:predicted transcriptional regulator